MSTTDPSTDEPRWWERDYTPGIGAAGGDRAIAREQRRRARIAARDARGAARAEHTALGRVETARRRRAQRDADRTLRAAVLDVRRARENDAVWRRAGDERRVLDRLVDALGDSVPLWAERTAHRGTTANTAAIFPFYNEEGIGHRGPVIGLNVLGGGAFCFDPWNLYGSTSFTREPSGERLIKNGNMVILGAPGEGKSSLVKTLAYRQAAFGRRCEFIDPKGEYAGVVQALGGVVVKLAPGGGQALNPLTDIGDPRARRSLLLSLARALLGRTLTSVEEVGVLGALQQADEKAASAYEVCLPHVEAALRDPGPTLVQALNASEAYAREQLRDLMLQLHLLTDGPLAGMFDRPTTNPPSTWERDAIAIDLSAITALAGSDDEGQNKPLAITMMCCAAFLTATALQRAERCTADGRPVPKTMRVNDEGWRVLAVPGQAQQYQSDFKLQRSTGVVNVVVMHRLSDLKAAGDDGSRAKKLAEGLRADADTIVIYRQDEGEMADLTEQLKLSVSEAATVQDLGQAQALWQVGKWRGIVQHLRSTTEECLSNTDEAMATNLPTRNRRESDSGQPATGTED
jgi:hypothetical protein